MNRKEFLKGAAGLVGLTAIGATGAEAEPLTLPVDVKEIVWEPSQNLRCTWGKWSVTGTHDFYTDSFSFRFVDCKSRQPQPKQAFCVEVYVDWDEGDHTIASVAPYLFRAVKEDGTELLTFPVLPAEVIPTTLLIHLNFTKGIMYIQPYFERGSSDYDIRGNHLFTPPKEIRI